MSAPTAGKKGKKKGKAKTVSLNDFLGESQTPGLIQKIDWAAEADEDFRSVNSSLAYQSTSAPKVIQLPTAPRAARSANIDLSRIPEVGPFTAFVGNLPYEVDETLLQEFFKDLTIVNVRLPEENGRFKGFGYVQFSDRQSLIKALEMNEETLQKRNIRVDIADNQNKDSGSSWRQGGDRKDSGPDRTEGDWRKASADESAQQAAEYSDRRDSAHGGNQSWDERRHSYEHGGGSSNHYNRSQHYSGYNRRQHYDYKGSYRNDSYDSSGGYRKNSQGYDNDRGYNDRGYGSRGYSDRGYSSRSYNDRDRGYNDRGYDRPRYGDRGGYERQRSDERYGGSRRDEPPRERPQLHLQPRQKPLENNAASTRSSSIFGAAKPVDTAAKEREIEEKIYSKQRSVEEPRAPEKKSSNIFGDAKPIDTSAREKEIEAKISAQKERLLSASKEPAPAPVKASVFGDAKPVDTTSRDREIEQKIRMREQEYTSHGEDRGSGRHSRISSERSDDAVPSSRRSRTSSTDDHTDAPPSNKSSETDIRRPEYKPAPAPKESAWGRKPALAMDKPAAEVPEKTFQDAPPANAWSKNPPPKQERGEREEAEGNSKEDEEEARRPEGASNDEDSMKNRNEPGDGSERKEQSYPTSSQVEPRYKSDSTSNSYQDRTASGSNRYNDSRQTSSRNFDNSSRGSRSDGNRDNRRRGDGDSRSYRSDRGGYSNDQRNRRDQGTRQKTRNDWNEKKRDSSRDSRPECDRLDGAGQDDHAASSVKPAKPRTKPMPTLEKEKPVEFATKSKFALLTLDSDEDDTITDK